MADVARSLILPGLEPRDDAQLKTLSLYWDELVMPFYLERSRGGTATRTSTATEQALEAAGVVRPVERRIDAKEHIASSICIEAGPADGSGEHNVRLSVSFRLPDDISARHGAALEELERRYSSSGPLSTDAGKAAIRELFSAVPQQDLWEAWCAAAADHYLARMRDAAEFAATNALAPLALSTPEHVGVLGLDPAAAGHDGTSAGALLSVVFQSFSVDAATPVEEILLFRDRHAAGLGRLRAALGDLAQELRDDQEPSRTLGRAYDMYRNRVVPLLGDLERVLKESSINFFLKSVLGASAVVIAPAEPISTMSKGVALTTQALDYRFSRDRLIEEHPYGYLHRLQRELEAEPLRLKPELVEASKDSPSRALRQLFLRQEPRVLLESLLGGERPVEFVRRGSAAS